MLCEADLPTAGGKKSCENPEAVTLPEVDKGFVSSKFLLKAWTSSLAANAMNCSRGGDKLLIHYQGKVSQTLL